MRDFESIDLEAETLHLCQKIDYSLREINRFDFFYSNPLGFLFIYFFE